MVPRNCILYIQAGLQALVRHPSDVEIFVGYRQNPNSNPNFSYNCKACQLRASQSGFHTCHWRHRKNLFLYNALTNLGTVRRLF
jgi:hypothetical protein